MVDILHRVGMQAPRQQVYEAVATPAGVAGWWTRDTRGDGGIGGRFVASFVDEAGEPIGSFTMELVELDPATGATWRVVDGPPEWVDTRIEFALSEADDGYTIVNFTHRGWAEPGEFMHHCSTKWGTFMLSLKDLVETGEGQPAPHDVRISDWH